MIDEDLSKMPLVELIKGLTLLDQQIGLTVLRYNKLRDEIIKRYPLLEEDEAFRLKDKEEEKSRLR